MATIANTTSTYIQNPERIRTGMETNRTRGRSSEVLQMDLNVTDYRNGKEEMNPAKNRAFAGITHNILI
jgi:hypothetical protein